MNNDVERSRERQQKRKGIKDKYYTTYQQKSCIKDWFCELCYGGVCLYVSLAELFWLIYFPVSDAPADSATVPNQNSGTRPSVAGRRGAGGWNWILFWVDVASYKFTATIYGMIRIP